VGAIEVGWGRVRAFLFDRGDYSIIEGHVAGFYIDADLGDALVAHGFLYKNGTYITIDHPLAFTGTSSYDVSDNGRIVGFYDRAASRAMEAASAEGQSLDPAALETWGARQQPGHPPTETLSQGDRLRSHLGPLVVQL
jgi:hypothetical protein